jgi:8-oxo-dGTP pyrophosphatase MutT (NUDIX family)
LLHRAPGRLLAGLWQCVSGSLRPGERVVAGALRELDEETGFDEAAIEELFDLDQVNQFHEPSVDAILTAAIFAVRVRSGKEPVLSHEHDAARWVSSSAALEIVVWPAYRESIRRIETDLVGADRAAWFRLELDGRRPAG